MNWINLTVFAVLASLGFYYAGTFMGQLMTVATCLWAWQIVVDDLDSRRKNLTDKKDRDDDLI